MRNKQNDWVFRLTEEFKVSPFAYFFTLSYRDDDLPNICSLDPKKEFPCLSRRDIQLFLKRLRKNSKVKLKYHIVGEYGPNTMRPHYHGLFFSFQPLDLEQIMKAWTHQDLIYKVFEPAISTAAAGYVSKYLCKTPFLPDYIKNSDRSVRPFTMCSNGLGLTYLETNSQLVNLKKSQLQDFVVIDGRKQSMPRYYRSKLFTDEERHELSSRKELKVSEDNIKEFSQFCKDRNLDEYDDQSFRKFELYKKMIRNDAWRQAFKKYKQKKEAL